MHNLEYFVSSNILIRFIAKEDKKYLDLDTTLVSNVTHQFQTCLSEGKRDRLFCVDSFDRLVRSSNISQVEALLSLASRISATMCGSIVITTRHSGLNFLFLTLIKFTNISSWKVFPRRV